MNALLMFILIFIAACGKEQPVNPGGGDGRREEDTSIAGMPAEQYFRRLLYSKDFAGRSWLLSNADSYSETVVTDKKRLRIFIGLNANNTFVLGYQELIAHKLHPTSGVEVYRKKKLEAAYVRGDWSVEKKTLVLKNFGVINVETDNRFVLTFTTDFHPLGENGVGFENKMQIYLRYNGFPAEDFRGEID